jgi:transposase-like protein
MSVKPSSHKANIPAKATFLAHLMNGKSVKAASEAAAINRRTVYDWRDQDSEFREAWEDAITGSIEVLEDEVRERALDRTDKNSHILLMFLVKKHKPEYRENYKTEISVNRESVKEYDFSSAEVDEAIAILRGAQESSS